MCWRGLLVWWRRLFNEFGWLVQWFGYARISYIYVCIYRICITHILFSIIPTYLVHHWGMCIAKPHCNHNNRRKHHSTTTHINWKPKIWLRYLITMQFIWSCYISNVWCSGVEFSVQYSPKVWNYISLHCYCWIDYLEMYELCNMLII